MKHWVVLVVLSFVVPAAAVSPGSWAHQTEADFSDGEFDKTVVTSLGQVKLAREVKVLLAAQDAPPVISAVVVARTTIYAASGTDGKIYKILRGKVSTLAEVPSTMTVSLLWQGKELLAGTAGDKAGIYRIDTKGKVTPVWTDAKVKYVWAIVPGAKGVLYAATGPEGEVYAIDAAGKAEVVFEAGELAKNILCLVRSVEGILYAGTDEKGLVIKIDPAKKSSRILLDATEKEVAALLLDGEGGLLAATSDAARASASGKAAPDGRKAGKPEKPPTPRPQPKATPRSKGQPAARPAPKAGGDKAIPAPETKRVAKPAAASKPAAPATKPTAKTAVEQAVPRNGPSTPTRPVGRPIVLPGRGPTPRPAAAGKGNAVYAIDSDGMVRTVFRRPVTILAVIRQGDRLILGTGNGGDIYSVAIDGSEVARLADTDARQITSLAVMRDGRVAFASANKGSVGVLGGGVATEGTFTSKALDAKQIARWGTLKIRANVPQGATLTVATRSGNVTEPDDKTWSDWSRQSPVTDDYLPIGTQAGRFIQYRLKFTGKDVATPAVEAVQMIYQVGNLPPVVAGVQVKASVKGKAAAATMVFRILLIQATDPNGDALRYKIEFRRIGTETWVQIAEKHGSASFIWDTRTVGDGKYELRVTASDDAANPPDSALSAVRISDPVVVDNTPPLMKDLVARGGAGVADVSGQVADAGSRVVSVHYAVNSQDEWVAVLPSDGIFDSSSEKFAFRVKDLKPGAHRIAVRTVDAYQNTSYSAVTVTVAK